MLVSQKAFVFNSEGKILALRRSSTDTGRPLTWDLPGGQLEEGENLQESMQREIREEIGIEVENLHIADGHASFGKDGLYQVQLLYKANVTNPVIVLSFEHDQYEWLSKDEFLERESSPKIKYFLSKL